MLTTPSFIIPGADTGSEQTISVTGVDATTAATSTVGRVVADSSEVIEVLVSTDEDDFEFNVLHNGNELFDNDQESDNGEEQYIPDQNLTSGANDYAEIKVEVTSTSAGGNSGTADFYVLVKATQD